MISHPDPHLLTPDCHPVFPAPSIRPPASPPVVYPPTAMVNVNDRVLFEGKPATVLQVWSKKARIITCYLEKKNVPIADLVFIDGQLEIPLDAPEVVAKAKSSEREIDIDGEEDSPAAEDPDFAPGDRVEYLGEILVVIRNVHCLAFCEFPPSKEFPEGRQTYILHRDLKKLDSIPSNGIEAEDGDRPADSIPTERIEVEDSDRRDDSIPKEGIEGDEGDRIDDSIPLERIEREGSDRIDDSIPLKRIEPGTGDRPADSIPLERIEPGTGDRIFAIGDPISYLGKLLIVNHIDGDRLTCIQPKQGDICEIFWENVPIREVTKLYSIPDKRIETGTGDRPADSIPTEGIEVEDGDRPDYSIPDPWIEGEVIAPAGDSILSEGIEGEAIAPAGDYIPSSGIEAVGRPDGSIPSYRIETPPDLILNSRLTHATRTIAPGPIDVSIDVLEETTVRLLALRESIEKELFRRGVLSGPIDPKESAGGVDAITAGRKRRKPGSSGFVGVYAKGEREYYRYTYFENGERKHKHIGPIDSLYAISFINEIEEMIEAGKPSGEILAVIPSRADYTQIKQRVSRK